MRYSVDLERLASQVERARVFSHHLEGAAVRLQTVVDELHLTWTGQAADALCQAHRGWARGTQELRDGLDAMVAAAAHAHDHYRAAAAANHDMWSPVG